MLVAGAGLLVAASFASAGNNAAALKKGGIWKAGEEGASVQVDPQIAYITTAWWLEYATAAKLFNYPDKRGPAGSKLVPEVASKFTVSRSGRVYTFTIRKGFRFSDGKPVTAKNFAYAIDRVANHDLASPGAAFITDPNGTNIVGAQKVNAGNGTRVSGAVAKRNKLIVRLTKADGTFMSKITMPFFQATSTKIPLTKEIVTVNQQLSVCRPVLLLAERCEYAHLAPPEQVLAQGTGPPAATEPGGYRRHVGVERADDVQPDEGEPARRGPDDSTR